MRSDPSVVQLSTARVALFLIVLIGTLGFSSARAEKGGIPAQVAAVEQAVQTLSTRFTQLIAVVNSQNALIAQLQQQNQELQAKLGCMSKTGNDVYFTGCNVHVRSGSGATNEPVNGLGNLIIGYNEDATFFNPSLDPSVRGGSHNLVVGAGHSYTSFGGFVAGRLNAILGFFASVSGGTHNTAAGEFVNIGGGSFNRANGQSTTVIGGQNNFADGSHSSVLGGLTNRATGQTAVVAGGRENASPGFGAVVSGGIGNVASGTNALISGGAANSAIGNQSSISGGGNNQSHGEGSSVSGGRFNAAQGNWSSVSGGQQRTAHNDYNWAAGGLLENQ